MWEIRYKTAATSVLQWTDAVFLTLESVLC
nr:MAG TPA: hypothetical protein [Caudoviricetes sp.]